ncbi:MAG TPA: hypothetical protein VFW79_08945 [Cellulomonas sp.]|uniref:hypothetical protein n=1 Tax=Cellulomonas sp. TaxID=40001 RepID=UPI002E37B232|nr:hypothetical protein [Cellulomonas sp.]HEX5332758.1 hypothetical protein [Cellulomonas sp.]
MWVMTVDQQGSQVVGDRVDAFLTEIAPYIASPERRAGVVRPFERTVGDEVQAVFADTALVVELTLHVLRLGGWSVGIGGGEVDEPLPESARAGSGSAFVLARAAVEAAKSRMRVVPLAVRGTDPDAAAEAEGVLMLLGASAARRTAAGWAVIDALTAGDPGLRQEDVAARLGITQQAVSQRLRTALWSEELAARPAAARLLSLAAGTGEDRDVRATPGAVRTPERS